LKAANLADSVEDEATCCYATQNKVWATDPQGMRWEYYRIVEDAEHFGSRGGVEAAREPETPTSGTCCA
jgi:hypothetical protein